MSGIRLSQVLAELDEKLTPEGKSKTFSIKFILNNGELVYLHRAISTGAGKMIMKDHALRGFLQVDKNFNKIGHIYPVKIWHLVEYNSNKIILDLCGGTGSWSKPYKVKSSPYRSVLILLTSVKT